MDEVFERALESYYSLVETHATLKQELVEDDIQYEGALGRLAGEIHANPTYKNAEMRKAAVDDAVAYDAGLAEMRADLQKKRVELACAESRVAGAERILGYLIAMKKAEAV